MMAVLLIATLALLDAPDPAAPPDLTVRESNGIYIVAARFTVPETPDEVLAVLKDYERIPRFMPDLISSVILQREAGWVMLEQEAVAKMMMFSKRIHLRLEVHEERHALRFSEQSGRSFDYYHGSWRAHREADRTVVDYELKAKPAFAVPEFLLTRSLKRDAHKMIDRLRGEIAAPGRTAAAR
jgi:ribosome-associated toxin RatA of RatAB toxin-antitoxin module